MSNTNPVRKEINCTNMNYKIILIFVLVSISAYIKCSENGEFCDIKGEGCDDQNEKYRYLLYDVNPPEGFNLRRDVYMRFAVFAYNLHKSPKLNLSNFKLVLPPWPNLYHWQTKKLLHIPWSHFFDLNSLQKFAPVIEMHNFFEEIGIMYSKIQIDDVYVLQHFEDMFKTGQFEDKMEVQKCNKEIQTNFYHYDNVTSSNIKCLSFHGHVTQLSKILDKSSSRTIFFDHAEVALHDSFGDKIYWQARRSMRFNKELRKIAAEFRQKYLNSSDVSDGTKLPEDWRDEKPKRNAEGGPYMAVHLRRRDFAWGRPKDVPSIKYAAKQIKDFLSKLNLKTVFIATDAPQKEYEELQHLLTSEITAYKYIPHEIIKSKYMEGGIAIIDQIICSHARYFIGTHESTFSFRIQEEREILGFPVDTTFNRLCGNDENSKCEKPSKWKIVY